MYVEDLPGSRPFFTEVLGLDSAMTLDFITTFVSPHSPITQISVLTVDPSGLRPSYSVEVTDLDACHQRAVANGCIIVYPLTDEPWGVRRFFVRDPSGSIANILAHR
ncbi:VOC family protein [Sphingomonas sp.]|uniref:VOC family protein n=1 Tax=Sphingomonas sp. TaxID=28214 RepID=UPI0025EA55DA|nr:VOC family protein [Sphingomonas sp.]